jgi:Fe-S-cluster containining protein
MPLSGRCTGQCCTVFTLSAGFHADLEAGGTQIADGFRDDAPFLLAMLVPLTAIEAAARLESLGFKRAGVVAPATDWQYDVNDLPRGWTIYPNALRPGWKAYAWSRASPREIFTCRHFNEVSHRCDAYAERPWLCRNYPDTDRVCMHCGFQYGLPDRDLGDESGGETLGSITY